MSINKIDQEITKIIGHAPPFTDDDYQSITGPLSLEHVDDIELLHKCPNLTRLEIYASNLKKLDVLKGLKKLSELKIFCCDLRNIEALEECKSLEILDLSFTFIQDISPLFKLPNLKEVSLLGTPLPEETYFEKIQELKEFIPDKCSYPPIIKISDEDAWELTLNMHEDGVPGCFSDLEKRDDVLVKPGIPAYTNLNCDAINVQSSTSVDIKISQGMSLEEIFKDLQKYDNKLRDLSYLLELPKPKGFNYEDTLAHVKSSSLTKSAQKNIISFFDNFSGLRYDWLNEENLSSFEKTEDIELPEWLRIFLLTFSSVLPGTFTRAKFEKFKHSSVYPESIPDFWFFIDLTFSVGSEYDYVTCQGNKLAIVGLEVESLTSILAVNIADPEDKSVYEFTYENINSNGEISPNRLKKVFDSYDEIFAYITAIGTPDETIEAAK